MEYEKSCGAVVFRKYHGNTELLLIKHTSGGHWSFPKGHVERGETERQTALREVKEETGLDIGLIDGFRQSVSYFPRHNIKKQVVYFLGSALSDHVVRQEEEISEICWVEIGRAYEMVTFKNDKTLINHAKAFLDRQAEVS